MGDTSNNKKVKDKLKSVLQKLKIISKSPPKLPPKHYPLKPFVKGDIGFYLSTIYHLCSQNKLTEEEFCKKVKLYLDQDLLVVDRKNVDKINETTDHYRDFLYIYIDFLKVIDVIKQQQEIDQEIYLLYCPFLLTKRLENFIKFDLSISVVNNRFDSFIDRHLDKIIDYNKNDNKTYILKLYKFLFNEVLINTYYYYDYRLELLKIHMRIKKELEDSLINAQNIIEKDLILFKKIKNGDKINDDMRKKIMKYIDNLDTGNKRVIFNLNIGKKEIDYINTIIEKIDTLCLFDIKEMFENENVITNIDVETDIDELKKLIKDFDFIYGNTIKELTNTEKNIIKQKLDNLKNIYNKNLDDFRSKFELKAGPPAISAALFPPIGTLPEKPESSTTTQKNAIDILMERLL